MNNITSPRFRGLRVGVLLAGPVLTALAVPEIGLRFGNPGETPLIALVALAIWSPLYFSIPALMMSEARDRALPGYPGLVASVVRGVKLIPDLLSASSPARLEMSASLVGFVGALAISLPLVAQLPPLV